MYILSADFGTSSVKIGIVNKSIQLVKIAKRDYELRGPGADFYEISIEEIENAFLDALREVAEYLPEVKAICFDTFAPSLVMMDKRGYALYPVVTHLDRRSRAYPQKILSVISKDHFRDITGTLPHAGGVTLTTLMWFREHNKKLFEQIYKIGHLSTYLYKKFTGEWAIDQVNASVTGMYETIREGNWSQEICSKFGIPMHILPEVVEMGSRSGKLINEEALKMGVPVGIPVILGTQDVASALVGADVQRTGETLCISGSSEMISVLTDKPVTNDKYYLRASGQKGLWQVFSITTGGFALDWFRKEFYREVDEEVFYTQYLSNILSTGFDTKGVTFLPYLTGDRQSLRKKKGSFSGLTLNTGREDMLCALILGIQQQTKSTYDLCKENGQANQSIKATGNMVEKAPYLKIKEAVFQGIPIQVIDNCPLKGNAIIAINTLEKN